MTAIRRPKPDDVDAIKRLAIAAKMFDEESVGFFDDILAGFFDGTAQGHAWLVVPGFDGELLAGAYYAPEPFADRMWNLYFLAVDPKAQGQGLGQRLIEHVETTLRGHGEDVARTLIVETSSTDQYADTRAFYARRGFVEEARIRQYYGPEDDKVVFWKQL
ncbi:MAG: N-acetyltransferase [Myxococcota bacterium]